METRTTLGQARRNQEAVTTPLDSIRDHNQRFFLRMYLRSNMDADQEIAKARCEFYKIDYAAARQWAQYT